MKIKPVRVTHLESLVERFDTAINQATAFLIAREQEITALKLCVLTRRHMLLNGDPGVAKTLLAMKFFKAFKGKFTVYSQQFMKATSTDQIFGPLNSKKYREEACWEHNTEGMLPEAHFAFLDEIYRASDMALPSMMMILNEGIFINGRKHMVCPLITAIGTTNYVTAREELTAFTDRWLIRADVAPLSSPTLRGRLFENYISKPSSDAVTDPFPFDFLPDIQQAVFLREFPSDLLELYDQLVTRFVTLSKLKISDRRMCWGLDVIRAMSTLTSPKKSEVTPSDLSAAQFVLLPIGNVELQQMFITVYSEVVGAFEKQIEENTTIAHLGRFVVSAREAVDEKASKKYLRGLLHKVEGVLSGIANMSDDDKPTIEENIKKMSEHTDELHSVRKTVIDLL